MSFLGKYSMTKSENFGNYLEALGVGMIMRILLRKGTRIIEIQQDGDEYIITTSTTFKNTEIKFKLDKEFDEITEDGRNCKSMITLEGQNKLLHTQNSDGFQTRIVREFEGNKMNMTMTMKDSDVCCTQVYTQLE